MFAEPTCIPHTFLYLTVRVDVEIHAFRIGALPVFAEKPALWHLFQVVFVKELTTFPFFAQSTQPMLADDGFIGTAVFEGAGGTFCAVSFKEETANVEGGGI